MFKKTEQEMAREARQVPPPAAGKRDAKVAWIGPSIAIKGDVSGSEDLVIDGQVQGQVLLKEHNVTVGRKGRLQADIHGRSIRIEGEVVGNLWGSEEVVIRQTGRVEGNLTAPRVTLENGSRFRGSIDMDGARAPEERRKEPTPGDTAAKQGSSASSSQGSGRPATAKNRERAAASNQAAG